jgi:hypothetical protein
MSLFRRLLIRLGITHNPSNSYEAAPVPGSPPFAANISERIADLAAIGEKESPGKTLRTSVEEIFLTVPTEVTGELEDSASRALKITFEEAVKADC